LQSYYLRGRLTDLCLYLREERGTGMRRNARNSYINALGSFKRLRCAGTRYDSCTK